MATLPQRRIEISIQLANNAQTNQPNTFSESGTNAVKITDKRMSVRIQNSGSPGGSTAQVQIWGLTPSLMNQLSTLGLIYNLIARNTLTISVGDSQGAMSTVFTGTITAGYSNYDAAPDVPFHFECNSGLADATANTTPTSFTGPTDVATIMAGFARQMNLGFENNGVNVKLINPYFAGNIDTQMKNCARQANINAERVNGNVLAIWPKGGNRNTTVIPLIDAPSGMIQYPVYTANGMIVKTLFNPKISFGGLVRVVSVLFAAAGESKAATASQVLPSDGNWACYKLDHNLDAQMPRGQWMSVVYGYNPRYPKPIVPGIRG